MARGRASETRPRGPTSDRYFDLVREFPLRPLRSDRELDRAIAVIDRLLARGKLASDEADYLDVLSDLVEKYEDEALPDRAGLRNRRVAAPGRIKRKNASDDRRRGEFA